MFVWTFEGVIQAIVAGIIGLLFLFIGGCFGLVWILEKYEAWQKGRNRDQ